MANKRKITTAIVAGVTAVALMLGGTFAWTSISQQAKNEAIVDINPGGRLHDDFNGTNKDVYVENFGDETTGVPIYARVRLYEYMEIGQQAGDKDITDGKKAESLIDGDTISDTAGWEIYKYGNTESVFSKYWEWTLGNDDEATLPYYMPTFNMNKDSLAADINGTYEGEITGDIVHYDDYKTYTADQPATGTEVYDHDSNTVEEDENDATLTIPYSTTNPDAPIDDAHVLLKEGVEHKAQQISTISTVMSMEEWIAAGSQPGPYWVFDTDGWAYWAQAIDPGKTTGLLLDGISMSKVPDDNWYYGINVKGQFATAGDLSAFNSSKSDDETWTSEAEELLAIISGAEEITINGPDTITLGTAATYTASRTLNGVEAAESAFTWKATDADGNAIDGVSIGTTSGELTVENTVTHGTEITVTATAAAPTTTLAEETDTPTRSKTMVVTVLGVVSVAAENDYLRYTPGTAETVNFTADLTGMTDGAGTIEWSVDNETDATTTITETEGNEKAATLTISADEAAPRITVTATYTPNDGGMEVKGTYDILHPDEIVASDNTEHTAYALVTQGSNGTTLAFVRSENKPTTENTYDSAQIVAVYDNINGTSNGPRWEDYSINHVRFDSPIQPKDTQMWFYRMTSLQSVEGWENLDTSIVYNMNKMFYDCGLSTLDLSGWDVSSVESMVSMFSGCSNLTELNLSNWKTTSLTTLELAFNECKKLEKIDLSGWDVSNLTSLNCAFLNCSNLTEIKGISEWNTANVTDMTQTFMNCGSLVTLDLSGWNVGNVENLSNTFFQCKKLTEIKGISEWNTAKVSDMGATFMFCEMLTADCSKWDVTNVTNHDDFNGYTYNVSAPAWVN